MKRTTHPLALKINIEVPSVNNLPSSFHPGSPSPYPTTANATGIRRTLSQYARISQKSQLQRQHQNAMAKYDRAQANIVEAQLDQARAELELIEAKLQRTRLLAPFSGLLVSGDLSQRLGGAVEKGEVLFEITPLDAYRVILEIDERRICEVRIGQQGSLVLASQPGRTYDFTPKTGETFSGSKRIWRKSKPV